MATPPFITGEKPQSRLLLFSVFVIFLAICPIGHARDDGLIQLLETLKDNGAITAEQYRQLKNTVEAQPPRTKAETADVTVSTRGGLEAQSNDGNFSIRLGGRVMIDAASYREDKVTLGSGTEVRRASVDLEGTLFADWGYELGVDFADISQKVKLKDAYLEYRDFSPARIRVGQFKEPFSLEELTSSKYISFIERALPNIFTPGRNIGIGYSTYSTNLSFSTGLFGEAANDGASSENDEGWGITARAAYAPWASKTRVLHLGLAASRREPDSSGKVKFSTRPESHVTDVKYLNTGTINNVGHTVTLGAELAWIDGPFSLQGESIQAHVARTGANELTFDGWYVFASYFLTGESRNYKAKTGVFGNIKPMDKRGAWELLLRYSTVDLNDSTVAGGEEHNTTLGLNWYANENLRFMLNYIVVNNDQKATANASSTVTSEDDPRIVQLRAQLHF